jgi:hypothetical protein
MPHETFEVRTVPRDPTVTVRPGDYCVEDVSRCPKPRNDNTAQESRVLVWRAPVLRDLQKSEEDVRQSNPVHGSKIARF